MTDQPGILPVEDDLISFITKQINLIEQKHMTRVTIFKDRQNFADYIAQLTLLACCKNVLIGALCLQIGLTSILPV